MKRRMIGRLAALALCLIAMAPLLAADLPTANVYLRSFNARSEWWSTLSDHSTYIREVSFNRDLKSGISHNRNYDGTSQIPLQGDWETQWEWNDELSRWDTVLGTDIARSIQAGVTNTGYNHWMNLWTRPPTRFEYARLSAVNLGGMTGLGGPDFWLGWTTCGGFSATDYHTRKATPDVYIALSNAVPGKSYNVQLCVEAHWFTHPCPGYETSTEGTLIDPHIFASDGTHHANYWINDGTTRRMVDTNGFVTLTVPAEGLAISLWLDPRFRREFSWWWWECTSATVLSERVAVAIDDSTGQVTSRSAQFGSLNVTTNIETGSISAGTGNVSGTLNVGGTADVTGNAYLRAGADVAGNLWTHGVLHAGQTGFLSLYDTGNEAVIESWGKPWLFYNNLHQVPAMTLSTNGDMVVHGSANIGGAADVAGNLWTHGVLHAGQTGFLSLYDTGNEAVIESWGKPWLFYNNLHQVDAMTLSTNGDLTVHGTATVAGTLLAGSFGTSGTVSGSLGDFKVLATDTFSGGSTTLSSTSATTYFSNSTGGTGVITLPAASSCDGQIRVVKVISPAPSGTVATVDDSKIDGADTYSLTSSNKFVMVQSDGSNWWIIGKN